MLGFSAISECAISDAPDAGPTEARIAVGSPLGAALLLGASSLAWAACASPLRSPAAVAYLQANAYAAAPAVLGAPVVRSLGAAAMASAATPLGTPQVNGSIPLASFAAAASPLGAALALAYHDFTAQMGDAVTRYVMDLTTPGGTVRVPISSWQATLQTGASNYVQCVVPAAASWASSINGATAFTISRTATPAGGSTVEYEMASAPLQTASYAQGTSNFTCTISGYSPAFSAADGGTPPTTYDRTLTGVRSVTTGSGNTRVRCAIDWLLRPGQRAYYDDGSSFVCAFINYYVPKESDAYMDAGD